MQLVWAFPTAIANGQMLFLFNHLVAISGTQIVNGAQMQCTALRELPRAPKYSLTLIPGNLLKTLLNVMESAEITIRMIIILVTLPLLKCLLRNQMKSARARRFPCVREF